MLELVFLEGSRRGDAIRLTFENAWFGRQPTCDFVLQGEGVSRAHFSIARRGVDYVLVDNNSTNGTFVNRLKTTAVTLRAGYQIVAGFNVMQVREVADEASMAFRFVAERKGVEGGTQVIEQSTILLGRKSICQVHLNDPSVAPVHAELDRQPEGVWITDQSSGAGVYVNGQRVVKQQLRNSDVVTIRSFVITISLTEETCVLGIQDTNEATPLALEKLPANYREVIAPPPRTEAGDTKPSAAIAGLPVWMQQKAPIWVPTSDILPNRFRSALVLVCVFGGLAWAAYAWAARSYSLYSPGPTSPLHSTTHAKFRADLAKNQASSDCAACHPGFSQVQDSSCQTCHPGTHTIPKHQAKAIACATCHPEHREPHLNLARTVGATCQSAGCHVRVHQKPALVLASQKRSTPAPVAQAVDFEANFHFGDEKDTHPQHKTANVKCLACHDDEEAEKTVPRDVMRMRCLTCHGFGPEATLQVRCFSCHFEHPLKKPEAILAAARVPDSPAAASSLAGRKGLVLLIGVLGAAPLFYFLVAAGSLRWEQRALRMRAAASGPTIIPVLAAEQIAAAPEVLPATGATTTAPQTTPADDQAPGGHLRPQIDLDLCVGCGTCVHVCPFSVLEIVNEKAIAARLGDCTGFAACAAECPTEAIKLVGGGAMQTQELPVFGPNLETTVPGLYLAGEVTGKALIKVAINQGKKVVDSILTRRPQPGEPYDVIVVGAGPAGTSTALAALQERLTVLVLEQGTLANTIQNYPRQKFVMAEPVMIPLHGPLWMGETSKEALIERWQQIVTSTGLVIHEEEKVIRVVRNPGNFQVQTTKGEYRGARLVLAIGRRGSPRKLGVPGEDSAKVAYNLLDADAYRGRAICVVGGGDSGIEAANGLARVDLQNRVSLVHRGEDFSRAKPRNQKKIKKSIEEGRMGVFFNSAVTEIRTRSLLVQSPVGLHEIDNDFVFVMVGGENPKKFLTECGVEFSHRAL